MQGVQRRQTARTGVGAAQGKTLENERLKGSESDEEEQQRDDTAHESTGDFELDSGWNDQQETRAGVQMQLSVLP